MVYCGNHSLNCVISGCTDILLHQAEMLYATNTKLYSDFDVGCDNADSTHCVKLRNRKYQKSHRRSAAVACLNFG